MTGIEQDGDETDTIEQMHPDRVGHILSAGEKKPVRVYLEDGEITVPIKPVKERRGPETVTVPCACFDAIVDMVDIADAGETIYARFHLPESEWCRLGLHKHWEEDNAEDWRCERIIEVWLSRFKNASSGEYDSDRYSSPVPSDSPTVTIYEEHDFEINSPPAPFDRPDLEFDVATAESVSNYHNARTRHTLGSVKTVELLDSIDEWPEKRDVSPPNGRYKIPSKHPQVDFDEVDPLPIDRNILAAVHAINRHAKRLNEEADRAYKIGEGAEAKVKSTQKKALYDAKTIAVHRLTKSAPDAVDLRLHGLYEDVEMYCFRFSTDYSFHQPRDAVDDELLDAVGWNIHNEEAREIDFQPSTDVSNLQLSLSEALGVLSSHGIDANDHLQTEVVEDYTFGYRISTIFRIDDDDS
jgi:hypothetical protein